MKTGSDRKEFVTFSPDLVAQDVVANYWIRQVSVRLRREICWRWHQQGAPATTQTLPPLADRLIESLDLTRYGAEKQAFFHSDVTAKYLTDQLMAEPPQFDRPPEPGSFGWVVKSLDLDQVSAFVLALGLMVAFDQAASEVIAACLNDPTATYPTLALAQKLWDHPEAILAIADLTHPLWCYGLLKPVPGSPSGSIVDWHSPLTVPPLVANRLLFPHAPLPQVLMPLSNTADAPLLEKAKLVALRLRSLPTDRLRIVPVRGGKGAILTDTIQGISSLTGRKVVALQDFPTLLAHDGYLKSLIPLCWLNGLDLFIASRGISSQDGEEGQPYGKLLSLPSIPITVFLGIRDRTELPHLPNHRLQPVVDIPTLTYDDRLACWQQVLGSAAPALQPSIAECARRFRYEPGTIQTIGEGLRGRATQLTSEDLFAACRAELELDMGDLAQSVTPRFRAEELVLPAKQQALFQDVYQAMQSLTEVHYSWGTARAWNECGISVLFAGPPGTGKTMAAEVLAAKLKLPMYRIDLSQVVNKYIGETEKNLKRLFDAADISDTLLFFDEADALFGRRTEVKDAHDRYANLEISYLLERMERFKGLAILATNRKKDLDEAFLRRLRYIIDFPLPDVKERRRIWQQVIPTYVDGSQLNVDFLAKQFPLAGGHIRSIVFNACLQAAGNGKGVWGEGEIGRGGEAVPRDSWEVKELHPLPMEQVVIAVKREYDKLNRSISLQQFGPYTKLIEEMDRG
jgi:hypothetical protein